METTERTVQREMARLETWLVVYELASRKLAQATDGWSAIDRGEDSATFFRYKGQLHDLGEFTRDYGITKGAGLPEHLSHWEGYRADSFFSALVVRLVDDGERVVVGLVLS